MSEPKVFLREIEVQELYLLHHEHRQHRQHLEHMVAPAFYEIANNGRRVEREAVIEWLLNKDVDARWELTAFSGHELGRSHVHVVYHAQQVAGKRRPSVGSWRSSIWRWNEDLALWQICFHQATSVQ